MGSDYAMSPPPPPALWEQVKILQERDEGQRRRILDLETEVQRLKLQHDDDTQKLAQAIRNGDIRIWREPRTQNEADPPWA